MWLYAWPPQSYFVAVNGDLAVSTPNLLSYNVFLPAWHDLRCVRARVRAAIVTLSKVNWRICDVPCIVIATTWPCKLIFTTRSFFFRRFRPENVFFLFQISNLRETLRFNIEVIFRNTLTQLFVYKTLGFILICNFMQNLRESYYFLMINSLIFEFLHFVREISSWKFVNRI